MKQTFIQSNLRKIGSMVQRLVDRFIPDKTIFFASYIFERVLPDSAIGLLTLLPATGSKQKLTIEVDVMLTVCNLPLELIMLTRRIF
jgi:hypothetical protein